MAVLTALAVILVEDSIPRLKKEKIFPGFLVFLRSKMAHSAGLRVRALIELNTVAIEIVMANCLKSVPVMPGMKMVGTNTASRTSVVAITGPETSRIDTMAASCGSLPSWI